MTTSTFPGTGLRTFDVARTRSEFPILRGLSRGRPLIYLDSAASAQKPAAVIDAIARFYRSDYANIHRGVYDLSERSTRAWDDARAHVARFIGAATADEVVFVRGTTEAINLVAASFLAPRLQRGGTVLVTEMEHHGNIVPWQLAGASTRPIPIFDDGDLDLAAAERLLAGGPALLAVTHVSNVLGTINPIAELSRMARRHGVPVLVDGAQAAPHLPVDVRALGCDFYCFSGHKLFGPTGIGVLWAREEHLRAMPPYQGGGDMIDEVTFARTTYAPPPRRFEAGTPDIAGAVGLDAAMSWLGEQDRDGIAGHEDALRDHALSALGALPGLRVLGAPARRAAVVAFTVDGVHPHDLASLLDADGICVRAGHHCTQPLHRRFGLQATARASFAPYNTHDDVDALAAAIARARKVFG
ncbi:MAG: aminotransferase class V-fold PLP-dependent enzyme [Gemmatimonadales bacterium]